LLEKMSAPWATAPLAPACAACCVSCGVISPAPNAESCSTTPCRPGAVAVTQIVRASSETAMPAARKEGTASARMARTATTLPPCVMRTMLLLLRLRT